MVFAMLVDVEEVGPVTGLECGFDTRGALEWSCLVIDPNNREEVPWGAVFVLE